MGPEATQESDGNRVADENRLSSAVQSLNAFLESNAVATLQSATKDLALSEPELLKLIEPQLLKLAFD